MDQKLERCASRKTQPKERVETVKRKLTALLPVLMAVLMLLAACGGGSVKEGCLLIDGKNVEFPWVLRIDGRDIDAAMYRYQFLQMRDETAEDETWDMTVEENSVLHKQQVAEFLALMVATEDLAGEYGIFRGADSAAHAQTQLDATKARYADEDEFAEALAGQYMTEALYRELLEQDYLQSQLYQAMFGEGGSYYLSDEDLVRTVDEEYVRVRYLSLNYDSSNKTEKLALAAELQRRIADGENFVDLVNTYGEERGMNGNPDGLYLCENMTTDPVFESACFALNVDEVSDTVVSDSAIYIIKRLPVEAEYVSANAEILRSNHYSLIFGEMILQRAKAFSIETCDRYDRITLTSMN